MSSSLSLSLPLSLSLCLSLESKSSFAVPFFGLRFSSTRNFVIFRTALPQEVKSSTTATDYIHSGIYSQTARPTQHINLQLYCIYIHTHTHTIIFIMMVTSYLWSSLQSLLRSLLQNLGLAGKQGNILLLGLDNAGKTTLLHRLKTGGEIRPFPPTDRPTLEEFQISTGRGVAGAGGTVLNLQAWDLGGHECVRYLWEDYVSTQVSAVLFVCDAADSERLEEAAYELDALVGEGLLQDIPVALLLNKCDLPQAMSTQEISERLEWERLKQEHWKKSSTSSSLQDETEEEEENGRSSRRRTSSSNGHVASSSQKEMMAVFRISVLNGEGYQDAFRWISTFL